MFEPSSAFIINWNTSAYSIKSLAALLMGVQTILVQYNRLKCYFICNIQNALFWRFDMQRAIMFILEGWLMLIMRHSANHVAKK